MFQKYVVNWVFPVGLILGATVGLPNQPQVVMAQINSVNLYTQHNQFPQAKPSVEIDKQVQLPLNSPKPELQGMGLLSRSCRDAILKVDTQVAWWIEQMIQKMTPTERREADLNFLRRRIIHASKSLDTRTLEVHLSNPSAIFRPANDRSKDETEYVKISQGLAPVCPEVDKFVFSSAGSFQRWTMRRTNFAVVHSKN